MKRNIALLTDMERAQLPLVISRRSRFKALLKSSLVNYRSLFSNCLMIQGKPGTGKTNLTETFMDEDYGYFCPECGEFVDYPYAEFDCGEIICDSCDEIIKVADLKYIPADITTTEFAIK